MPIPPNIDGIAVRGECCMLWLLAACDNHQIGIPEVTVGVGGSSSLHSVGSRLVDVAPATSFTSSSIK